MAEFTHLDLFCGPGGFATGFEWAEFKTLLGLDVHAPSLGTYAHNHPDAATILGDIRDVASEDIAARIGDRHVNVITAGVPCEGFSRSNRNRLKYTDERNFLFLEFLRVVEHFQPEFILLENVANLARHDNGFYAAEIEGGMQDLGYQTTSTILDAVSYGVPQRRRRVMFAGAKPGYAFTWPRATHGPQLLPHVTVGAALLDLPPLDNNECKTAYTSEPHSDYARLMRGTQMELLNHQAPNHPEATVAMIEATEPGKPMYAKFKQRIRLHQDGICPTLVSGGIRPQFAYGHPTQPRGMSIRERARIQSFPDWYDFQGGIVQGRVQTGDAVPPLLAEAVAQQFMQSLRIGPSEELSDLGVINLVKQPLMESPVQQLSLLP